MAGVSQNSIKSRMKSVDSTRQITKAMELVATSKLRRAKEKAESSRPFHYTLNEVMSDMLSLAGEVESPYLGERKVKKTCFIVIAGDRGLAGGYNSNVFKAVKAASEGIEYCVLPIGKKAIEYYRRRGAEIIDLGYNAVTDVGAEGAEDIATALCREYVEGRIDRIVVFYTKFVSMLTQETTCEQLLPFKLEERENKSYGSAIFDGSPVEMLEYLVPFSISGQLYSALCEAEASEHGSRRNAMSSANKNADEIIANLRLSYNRARQAAITQEITEIVSGAEAL